MPRAPLLSRKAHATLFNGFPQGGDIVREERGTRRSRVGAPWGLASPPRALAAVVARWPGSLRHRYRKAPTVPNACAGRHAAGEEHSGELHPWACRRRPQLHTPWDRPRCRRSAGQPPRAVLTEGHAPNATFWRTEEGPSPRPPGSSVERLGDQARWGPVCSQGARPCRGHLGPKAVTAQSGCPST